MSAALSDGQIWANPSRHWTEPATWVPEPPAWHADAACRNVAKDVFFPGDHESLAEARAVCARCPVTDACLEWALDNNELGVWAGTSERQRRAIRRAGGLPTIVCKGCGSTFQGMPGSRYCHVDCQRRRRIAQVTAYNRGKKAAS